MIFCDPAYSVKACLVSRGMTGVYSYPATLWFVGELLGTRSPCSLPYMWTARMNWRKLLLHVVRLARSFAFANAGNSSAARIAMMAMTTNNSINVNARC